MAQDGNERQKPKVNKRGNIMISPVSLLSAFSEPFSAFLKGGRRSRCVSLN